MKKRIRFNDDMRCRISYCDRTQSRACCRHCEIFFRCAEHCLRDPNVCGEIWRSEGGKANGSNANE